MKELKGMTALELGGYIRRGELSVPEVTAHALKWAGEAGNNAFITLTGEEAMARAGELQARLGEGCGPLYGVPMALKDNICTRGVATTCASRMLEGFVPPYTAFAARRLEEGGAVCIGKTNMDEFAMGYTGETSHFGPVTNPWDKSRGAGGSSSGSAGAVAGGVCPYALGSDTGGSVRLPAAWCGVTGIRPTYGTVSRNGLVAYASSFDQIGPIARDAADCAAVLDLIRGRDRGDATSLDPPGGPLLRGLTGDLRGLTVGIPKECFGPGLSGEIARGVLEAAEVLQSRGAVLREVSLPVMELVVAAYYVIASAEASSNLARYDGVRYGHRAEGCTGPEELYRRSRGEGFGKEVKRRILLGTFVLSEGHYDQFYKKAQGAREAVERAFEGAFRSCGLILTPTAPTTAPRLGERGGDPLEGYLGDVYTVPASLAGLPALSMPCGFDGGGLPMGAQLIGPRFGEGILLNAAFGYQQDTDHHKRRAWT